MTGWRRHMTGAPLPIDLVSLSIRACEGMDHDRPGSWLPGVNKDIDGSREVWKFVSQYRL